MAANTTSILQPIDQAVISTFKSYYLRNTFCKGIDARDGDFSDGSGQSQLKTLWNRFTILDANESIHDSWEEVKTSTLTTVWKKLISELMDNFEGFKTSVEEVTAVVVEIIRELVLRVKPEDVNCWNFMIKPVGKKLLLMDEWRKWFLETESTPGEDAVKTVEMTTKD